MPKFSAEMYWIATKICCCISEAQMLDIMGAIDMLSIGLINLCLKSDKCSIALRNIEHEDKQLEDVIVNNIDQISPRPSMKKKKKKCQ